MRRYFRWLNYRDAVLANLNALMVAYPAGRQFADDFPELKPLLRSCFDGGASLHSSALKISERIIGNFIDQLDSGRKAKTIEALLESDPESFEELAHGNIAGRRAGPPDPTIFMAELIGCALFMAGRMSSQGMLGHSDFDGFLQRVAERLGVNAAGLEALRASFAV
jgi:hypothetical protein